MCFLSHPYTLCNENTKIRGSAFWFSHPTAPRNGYFCKLRGNKKCGLAAFCVEPALGPLAPFSLPLSPHTHSFSLSLSNSKNRGDWVAQSVKHLSLGFGTGRVLTLGECEPCIGLSADSGEFA